ncbi:hypothetical protein [Bradyrhizobium sp. SK17]|jgi:hypothetical protein|uniref:hypothetical protein n=1 Tax=Bradyrhizobium sp. SK17 TaxID=2057741 RepID=UPI0012FD4F01|nr:hypothetical protein [Bradyrhizobium sp. SK17]
MKLVILAGLAVVLSAGVAAAQTSVGGPGKRTEQIGGPNAMTNPVMAPPRTPRPSLPPKAGAPAAPRHFAR